MVRGLPQWGQQSRGDTHIRLLFIHLPDDGLIVVGFLAAGTGALEEAVVPLGVEETLFVEARFLKAVVHVGSEDEVIFVLYQVQKVLVNRLRGVHIAVDVDIPAPIGPEFF